MNFTKLRYVVAVDREGGISAAAKVLNITQSAVTKAVADLERDLGFALFDRRAHGVTATLQGRLFIDRAARILSDMEQLVADTREGRDSRDRMLRIAVSPPSLEGMMNRAVRHLVLNRADVRVQLRGAPMETGIQLLRQGDVDTLIGPAKALVARGFETHELPPIRAFMYGRRGHPLAGKPVTAKQLAGFPIIAPDISGPYADPLQEVFGYLDGDPTRNLHILENFPTASGIIERSDALGVVVDAFMRSRSFRSRFEVLDYDMGEPLPLVLAHRADQKPSRAMGWWLEALKAHPPTGGVPE